MRLYASTCFCSASDIPSWMQTSLMAGAAGVGSGIHGAVKMKEADVIKKDAESCYKMSTERVEKSNKSASRKADELGILELNILNGFDDFSDTIEKIQNRPELFFIYCFKRFEIFFSYNLQFS